MAPYLHRSGGQFPQQAAQPGLGPAHRPAPYLAPPEPKAGLAAGPYPVSVHYSCFDR